MNLVLSSFMMLTQLAPQPGDGGAELFLDAAGPVYAQRRGPPNGGRQKVTLTYPGLAAAVDAEVNGEVVVSLKPGGRARWQDWGLTPVRPLFESIGVYLASDTRGADGLAAAARLSPLVAAGDLRAAVPNLYLRHTLHAAPNDPRYSAQWYFAALDMPAAWSLYEGDADTTIVVIDNGCDLDHPDLALQMDPGRDVVASDSNPSYVPLEPGNEHGTACAGIAAARTDNALGIAGGCPRCRLRCVRLLPGDNELVPLSADVEAFAFAYDVGAAVVTNSWGFVDPIAVPSALADAINEVFDHGRDGRGALVLFAAGNDDREVSPQELLGVRGVLGIGAINNYGEKTSFTNYGAPLDLVAPAGTFTTDIAGSDGNDPGDYTGNFGGTSAACPVAAGVAALVAGAAPDLTAQEVYDLLMATAAPSPYAAPDANGHDAVYGYGVIDPVAALSEALDSPAGGGDGGCFGSGLFGMLGLSLYSRTRAKHSISRGSGDKLGKTM